MVTVTHENKQYTLVWNDIPNLVKYAVSQNFSVCNLTRDAIVEAGQNIKFTEVFTKEIFFRKFTNVTQTSFNNYINFISPSNKKIISVGSGISTVELIISQYATESQIFLLDKSELSRGPDKVYDKESYFSETNNHGFYNSWDVVKDAIKNSDLNSSRYVFLDPIDDWPIDVDVIMSLYSWCWHYPFEVYSEKMLNSLKIGGTLILEIQNPPNFRDVSKQISELLGGDPIFLQKKYIKQSDNVSEGNKKNLDSTNCFGGLYVWTRKK
jgi:hypothetical protein